MKRLFILNILFHLISAIASENDSTGVVGLDFDKIYRRYEIKEIILNDPLSQEEFSIVTEDEQSESKLKRSGLIYRGVKFNADSGVDIVSGFNLNLNGELSENLEAEAVLSDDNLAMTEEGTSEILSEIDNIYIQFKHPNFISRMGNYNLKYSSRGEFGDINKDLSGVLFKTNYKSNNLDAFVSSESSSYKSIELTVLEGIQGPYDLDNNIIDLKEIIPGSEDVYLNGVKLIKGSDYYIDYFSNQIFFTPLRPVHQGDKVTVDIEFTSVDYKKYVYGIYSENKFINDKLTVQTDYYTETDDEKNPLSFDGTEEEIQIIRDAGTDLNNSYISGITFLGLNKGDYNISPDSLYYEYTGKDLGEYDIVFSRFEDSGDYVMEYDSTGTVYYVYDPLNGNYLPLKHLPLPTDLSTLHANLNYEGEVFSFTAETVSSSYQKNKLAKNSKVNFDGFGDHEKISLRTKDLKIFDKNTGKYKFSISRKYYNNKLILPERLSDSNFNDNFGIDIDQDSISYEKYMFSVEHTLGTFLNNKIDLSYYKLSEAIETQKADLDLLGDFKKYGYQLAYTNRISKSGTDEDTLEKYYTGIYFDLFQFRITPFTGKEKKLNVNDTLTAGSMEDKYGLLTNFTHDSHNLKNRIEYNIFSEQDHAWKEQKYQISNLMEYKGRYSTNLISEVMWNWVSNTVKDSSDSYYNLISARSNYNYKSNYRIFLGYETERTLVYNKIRHFYEVEDGTGDYRYVDGEYIPDEFGNYNFYIISLDDPKAATGVKFNLRTFFDIPDIANNDNIMYWLSRIDLEQNVNIEERSLTETPLDIVLLKIPTFQNDSTVFGIIESDTKLYFIKKGTTGINYSVKFLRKLMNEYVYSGEKDEITDQTLEFRTKISDLSINLNFQRSNYLKYQINPRFITDELSRNKLNISTFYDINKQIRLLFDLGYGLEEELIRKITTQEVSLNPSIKFSFHRNGIIRSSFKIINITTDSANIPYMMNSGLGKGLSYSWNSTANYNFSKSIKGNFYYTGRYYSYDTKPFHELRIEIRMEF
ncbi:MAG: hypothetical protein JXR69_03820 [Candidatus Delongbacteria bacterium]|nr:hypothetical protein [Candidatus Delongbacteria bacterium]